MDYQSYNYNLDVMENITKTNTSPAFMKQISIQTIQQRSPEQEWLHLYADGSYIDKEAGAVVYCNYSLLHPSRGL